MGLSDFRAGCFAALWLASGTLLPHRPDLPRCPAILLGVLRPLPRWNGLGALAGCFPSPRRPSPFLERVGFHVCTIEACSGFTHVAAHRFARTTYVALCPWSFKLCDFHTSVQVAT